MSRGFPFHAFRTEVLTTELIFFLIILGVCLFIFFKTREAYQLTKHEGVKHFREIFLFFALAFFFRMLLVAFVIFSVHFQVLIPLAYRLISLTLVSYFSMMAVLSIVVSVGHKKFKVSDSNTYLWMNILSVVIAISTLLTGSQWLLIIVESVVFLFILFFILFQKGKMNFNNINYVLLSIFWVFNIFVFMKFLHMPMFSRMLFYVLSIGIFSVILFRVVKRFKLNGKKKR